MAKPLIGQVAAAIQDPQLSDNFLLIINNIPTGANNLPFVMLCKNATKPGATLNAVEVQVFGHTLEFAGNVTFGHDMNAEFYENRDFTIHKEIENWMQFCRGFDTQSGAFKSEYARDATLQVYNSKQEVVAEYSIEGVWPSQLPDTNFSGESSTAITIPAVFKYDKYKRVR